MINALRWIGGPGVLLARTARAARRGPINWRECLVQLNEIGAKSSWLVGVGMAFFGMVLVTIAYAQARKYVGSVAIVGPAYFQLLIRELAPLVAGMLVASRAAASTSAELASMSVNEQIEALELSAADPLVELVVPRMVASVLALPALIAIGTAAATASAVLTVTWAFGADGTAFRDPALVQLSDLACSATKSVLFGVFIPLAAANRGLRAKGGAAAVGEAVTDGVVEACLGVLVIDFAVAIVFRVLGL